MVMSSEDEERKFLFDHWHNLEMVVELTEEQFYLMVGDDNKENVRGEIVSILAKGIEDSLRGEQKVRHALCANELKETIEQILDKKLTLSNIYFHLAKLEENGIIQVVGSLPSGRRYTAYYGRTARIYMLKEEKTEPIMELEKYESKKNMLDQLSTIVKKQNPGIEEEEISNLFKRFNMLNRHRIILHNEYTDAYKKWLELNEEFLRQSDINLIQLYYLFQEFINFQEDIVETFQKMSKLIGFNEIIKNCVKLPNKNN